MGMMTGQFPQFPPRQAPAGPPPVEIRPPPKQFVFVDERRQVKRPAPAPSVEIVEDEPPSDNDDCDEAEFEQLDYDEEEFSDELPPLEDEADEDLVEPSGPPPVLAVPEPAVIPAPLPPPVSQPAVVQAAMSQPAEAPTPAPKKPKKRSKRPTAPLSL